MKIHQEFKKNFPGLQFNILLKKYTTFKIGGPAKYFFQAKSKEELIKAIKFSQSVKLPFFILGGGSNVLVSDKGYDGLIIKIQMTKSKCQIKSKIQSPEIYAGAGVKLGDLVKLAVKNNLTGLEWLAGIPGTVGGAVYGNAGAFGETISDIVEKVEVLDTCQLKIKNYKLTNCQFNYRNSIFKKKKSLLILSCLFRLKRGNKEEIKKKIKYFLDYRKKNHPLNFPSAGSIFKNPGKPARELIEKCGLKGKRIGRVEISTKHANFIVNLGEGRAEDVLRLIDLVKKKVKKRFGVGLQEEIKFLGF